MDPWSKGDYSRHIRQEPMVVEKLPEDNPPIDRVPGRGLLVLPILEARRRWNGGENRDAGLSPRPAGARGENGPRGGARGWTRLPGPLVARPGGGLRQMAGWVGPGPPPALLQ